MNDLINILTALTITALLSAGTAKVFYEVYDTIKRESLEQVSKGLSSSEELANALTGEKLSF